MGHPHDGKDATPHNVTISRPFYISDREVTVAQFREFHAAASRPAYEPAAERIEDWEGQNTAYSPETNCPMQMVNCLDAVKFCNWLSRREDRPVCYIPSTTNTNTTSRVVDWQCDWDAAGYRLPTESEWEYACRAGSESRIAFGDDQRFLGDYAWYGDNSSGRTWPSALKLPNLWGLFDLHGNVWEWCYGWYDPDYYTEPESKADPRGPDGDTFRLLRGGSWINDHPANLSCSYRHNGHLPCRGRRQESQPTNRPDPRIEA
jgi:formylglycine-generating enzyme required for sulfatase activity